MIRTQVHLTEAQADGLKRIARTRGISMATLIREAIDRTLADEDTIRIRKRALSMAEGFRDREGATDVAERHDDYLAEIYEEDLR